MSDEELKFRSKIDLWLLILLSVACAAGPAAVYLNPPKHGALPPMVTLSLLAVPVVLFVWLYTTTAYTISGANLIVRGGPIRIVVPIDSITRISRSNSLASAATLSLSRLSVQYGRFNEVLISPKDRQGFVRAIVARVPNVVLEDLDEYR